MNLTAEDQARAAVGGQRTTAPGFQAFPGGTSEGTSAPPSQPSGKVFIPGQGWVDRSPPRVPVPMPDNSTPPVPLPVPRPENATPATPAPTGGITTVAPPKARVGKVDVAQAIPGEDLEPATATPETPAKKEELKGAEKTKLQKVDDALSDLGKAMQGVKAPPPLQPPQIGAPRLPGVAGISGGAAALQQLLAARQQGLTPASIMPILHLLGRV